MSHKIKKIVLENIRRGGYERTIAVNIVDGRSVVINDHYRCLKLKDRSDEFNHVILMKEEILRIADELRNWQGEEDDK